MAENPALSASEMSPRQLRGFTFFAAFYLAEPSNEIKWCLNAWYHQRHNQDRWIDAAERYEAARVKLPAVEEKDGTDGAD